VVTVAEALALPEIADGRPRVVAGAAGLQATVRWVHVAEVADIAALLQGGELILTTGIALPDDPAGLERYVTDLATARVSGVVVELGRHFARLPPGMVDAAERSGLPLVELGREVRFVDVTQSVHSRIVHAQFEELERAKEIHEIFTDLSLEGASVAEIVREVAARAACPVVLENLSHQVLAHGGVGAERILADWERRSRTVPFPERTDVGEGEGWLVTRVAVRGEPWGRLVLVPDGEPSTTQVLVAERGASAIAIERLVERDRESLERQVHRGLLAELLERGSVGAKAVAVRSRAVGVVLDGRQLVGVVVRHDGDPQLAPLASQARDQQRTERVARAARVAGLSALVGVLRPGHVGLLVSLEPRADARSAVARLAHQITDGLGEQERARLVVAAGRAVGSAEHARRSLEEAIQVASVAEPGTVTPRGFVELPDVRVRGLLYLLRDDPRLQGFVERELGVLLAYDAEHPDERLVAALTALCRQGGNVAAAAKEFGLSRAAYYHRLARLEEVLGQPVTPVESLLSCHLALLGLGTIRSGSPTGQPGMPA
jgi:purine catabolism regulator